MEKTENKTREEILKVNKEKLQDLQEKVKKWSADRGITINGKSTTQTLKLISEMSEIFEAMTEPTPEKMMEKFKDAIGDNLVVLINLTELIKKEAKENGVDLETADLRWCNAEKDPGEGTIEISLIIDYGKLADAVGKQNYKEAITLINSSLKYLNALCILSNKFTLDEALESAYEEIKDRQGFLNENGNFIKTEDPNYEKLYKEFKERQKGK